MHEGRSHAEPAAECGESGFVHANRRPRAAGDAGICMHEGQSRAAKRLLCSKRGFVHAFHHARPSRGAGKFMHEGRSHAEPAAECGESGFVNERNGYLLPVSQLGVVRVQVVAHLPPYGDVIGLGYVVAEAAERIVSSLSGTHTSYDACVPDDAIASGS